MVNQQRPPSGISALILAATANHLDLVEDLIEAGANVNQTNEDGSPTLMITAYKGYLAIVETLIATGSEVNLKDKNGDTALNLAAKNYHQESILALFDTGANFLDITESLILAIRKGNIEAVKTLMPVCHNLNVPNQDEETLVMLAATERQADILKVLIAPKAKINIQDEDGRNTLTLRCR
ncbi:ankyrin repeat domain-containing protein [cyanobacterium endosymbiont of Epithemia clementina EcSB]|nr:ankyrin repeat domain-containing protein [cyanobacterium endosymbiont of Epithemia clementina EcSB]WGT66976.1 ankyrin repeat domain-containing protein [cyanobacterium endosymbiont of Epithemia clementina EcSB]